MLHSRARGAERSLRSLRPLPSPRFHVIVGTLNEHFASTPVGEFEQGSTRGPKGQSKNTISRPARSASAHGGRAVCIPMLCLPPGMCAGPWMRRNFFVENLPKMNWRNMEAGIVSRTFECPYCGNKIASDRGWDALAPNNNSQRIGNIRICPECTGPTFLPQAGQNKQFPGVHMVRR